MKHTHKIIFSFALSLLTASAFASGSDAPVDEVIVSASPAVSEITINWVARTGDADRYTVRAPFSVEDVLAHASTYRDNYKMDFLETTEGSALIAQVIENLNADRHPGDDFIDLVFRWNKSAQGAKYNMSVVAHFVSELYRKANN